MEFFRIRTPQQEQNITPKALYQILQEIQSRSTYHQINDISINFTFIIGALARLLAAFYSTRVRVECATCVEGTPSAPTRLTGALARPLCARSSSAAPRIVFPLFCSVQLPIFHCMETHYFESISFLK